MSDKVLIFGSTGQLGTDLVSVLQESGKFEVIPLTHEDADCTDAAAVRKVVLHSRPRFVINSAAYVRVDDCEDHASEAFAVNAIGALNIARASAEVDAFSVYISTDYVFDGEKKTPYVESDQPNPINVYGTSKLAGELLVRQVAPRWLIVRVASLFGKTAARGKDGNFVETIITKAKAGEPLRVVNDVRMSPAYTRDASIGMMKLLKTGTEDIVHLTNDGACSWYEFANQIVELMDLGASVHPVLSKQYPTRARRPKNSALRGERSPVKLRSWRDALAAYLIDKGHMSVTLAATADR